MDVLLDPNVGYLVLVAGFWLAIMALLSPGTGLFELGALAAFGFAGWVIFNSTINFWALGVLIFGVLPFLYAMRISGKRIFLVIAILALLVGSVFLFDGSGWLPVINPLLALATSAITAIFAWVVTVKIMESEHIPTTHDLGTLIGAVGEARTSIRDSGSVQLEGELWSARSREHIPAGAQVRVVAREGFVLLVEKV